MRKKQQFPVWTESLSQLSSWYEGGLGQSILDDLEIQLKPLVGSIFGYRGLQVGHLSERFKPMAYAGIHRPVLLDPNGKGDICGEAMRLPIAADTMKLVVLPHTLDISEEPYQVLREVDRVLTDDGHVIIIGFNPWGLMGLRRSLVRWQRGTPWNSHFYPRHRVSEWLSVLNFKICESHAFHLRPPINSQRVQARLSSLEALRPWLGAFGSAYVMYAQKQTIPLTPARKLWLRSQHGLGVRGMAATASRKPVSSSVQSRRSLRLVTDNNAGIRYPMPAKDNGNKNRSPGGEDGH